MENPKELIEKYNSLLKDTGICFHYKVTYLNFFKEYLCDETVEEVKNFLMCREHEVGGNIQFTLPSSISSDLTNLKYFVLHDRGNSSWHFGNVIIEAHRYPPANLGAPVKLNVSSNVIPDNLNLTVNGRDIKINLSPRQMQHFPYDKPLDLKLTHVKDWEKTKSTINSINISPDLKYINDGNYVRNGFALGYDGSFKTDYIIKLEVVMGEELQKNCTDFSEYQDISISKVIYDISNDFDKVTEKLQTLRTLIELVV